MKYVLCYNNRFKGKRKYQDLLLGIIIQENKKVNIVSINGEITWRDCGRDFIMYYLKNLIHYPEVPGVKIKEVGKLEFEASIKKEAEKFPK